jgi:hypothetical protein
VTGQGLPEILSSDFQVGCYGSSSLALLVANTMNIAADLAGMADAAEMLSGVKSLWRSPR